LHICDICCVRTVCFGILLDCIELFTVCNFWKVHFTTVIMLIFFFGTNKYLIFLRIFLAYLVGNYFCKIMFADNPQRRVRQRTEEDVAAIRARIMNRAVIPERNVIRTYLLVAPLDSINEIIQTYHWGYLHNCAYVVLARLVRLFYANLEGLQNDDNGIILQSTIAGHVITVDPQIINQVIGVPVLQISANPFNEVVLAPSLDELLEFYHVIP